MGKIIGFYGADHKCGATMICQCLGEALLQKWPELKIALVHAEAASGCDYSGDARVDMGGLFPYLERSSLDFSELAEKSAWRRNFSIIAGFTEAGAIDDFHPDMARFLLEGLSECFDLIICCCGADIQNGLSLGALLCADKRYMVMAPRESAVRRYEASRELLFQLRIGFDRIILNRFGTKSIYSPAYLSERLAMEKGIFTVVRESKFGDICEIDEKSLLRCRDGGFRRDIAKLSSQIAKDAGLQELYHG